MLMFYLLNDFILNDSNSDFYPIYIIFPKSYFCLEIDTSPIFIFPEIREIKFPKSDIADIFESGGKWGKLF